MRILKTLVIGTVVSLPMGIAQADGGFVRQILSSGITTATTYMTFKDDKQVAATREDASSFVASNGEIRGPYLEAFLQQVRSEQPELAASDLELASAVLAVQ